MPRQGMVIVQPILPDAVRENLVRQNVLNELDKIARQVRREFQRTVRTWNHNVTFTKGKVFTRGARGSEAQYGFHVETDSLIWGFLNEGTDVRNVRMIDGFEPKTTPNTYDSVEGYGGIADWSFGMPGIEARNWTLMAERDFQRPLLVAVTNAILRGLENQRLPRRGG